MTFSKQELGDDSPQASALPAYGGDSCLLSRSSVAGVGVFAVGSGMQPISSTDETNGRWQVGELYPNPIPKAGTSVKLPLNGTLATSFQVRLMDNLEREIISMTTDAVQGGQVLEMQIPLLAAGN